MRFQDSNRSELQIACDKDNVLFSITKEDNFGDVEQILDIALNKEQATYLANYILKIVKQ